MQVYNYTIHYMTSWQRIGLYLNNSKLGSLHVFTACSNEAPLELTKNIIYFLLTASVRHIHVIYIVMCK